MSAAFRPVRRKRRRRRRFRSRGGASAAGRDPGLKPMGAVSPSRLKRMVNIGNPFAGDGRRGQGWFMIRSFFRLIGMLMLACGFIFLVYDGARSIADQMLRLTRTADLWNDLGQASQTAFKASTEAISPWLWSLLNKAVLEQPVWAVLGVVGLLLLVAFRRGRPTIGYARD